MNFTKSYSTHEFHKALHSLWKDIPVIVFFYVVFFLSIFSTSFYLCFMQYVYVQQEISDKSPMQFTFVRFASLFIVAFLWVFLWIDFRYHISSNKCSFSDKCSSLLFLWKRGHIPPRLAVDHLNVVCPDFVPRVPFVGSMNCNVPMAFIRRKLVNKFRSVMW